MGRPNFTQRIPSDHPRDIDRLSSDLAGAQHIAGSSDGLPQQSQRFIITYITIVIVIVIYGNYIMMIIYMVYNGITFNIWVYNI